MKKYGLARGLTNYGDMDFSLYLRRSFASSMGYLREMLIKKIVGIAYPPSASTIAIVISQNYLMR